MRIDIRRVVLAVAAMVAALPIAVATPAGPASGEPAGDDFTRVEAYLRQHMTDTRTPGLAYAVVRGDQVVGQGAWGVDGDGAPVTAQTPFVLGSVTKSFTALAVMQLVEAGRIGLDIPVRRYVPWLRLADESVAARITVRELLTHTTGLPQVVAMGLTDRYDNTPGALARSVRDLATVSPTVSPGGEYQYSDANYMILGVLVETVTGETYGGYLRRSVLDPLGMTRSAATDVEARAIGGIPAGHRYYFGRPQRFDPPFDTSGVSYGFLGASLTDMTHYAIAQLNDGRYADAALLSGQGVAQLHAGVVATEGGGRYGMGWRESTLDGTGDRIVWHAGATANFFCNVVLVPGSDLAVIVLSNIYSLAMDWPLASAAFNVARIVRGGAVEAGSADPVFGWALAGLLAVAGVLLVLLVWMSVRAIRRRRRPVGAPPSRRRIVVGTLGWVLGCVGLAAGVLYGVPTFWDGAGLAQVLLFAPDIGHMIIVVAVLAGTLALLRLGLAGYALSGKVERVPRSVGPEHPLASTAG
ncbi:serine hydrolase domain-containing protein [Plantactinospora soyae]|uniref:CubicO group peptidase (Beta-lactamase class C family) n=1 Tax=Plantactinospora soyae TaxID=1544732 RepID=A0A927M326_9ACTN|nr:serine hydrolase domain-containing protein [Plantactinospora soyae]MBE1485915.1 CubicO group peptidase (beta-lactamase class C family) [Plantactinospora soyae]